MKHSVPLLNHYLWCMFQQDCIKFGGVRAQKTPKMAEFKDAPSPGKLLKNYMLRTTNAIKMKLITIVYLDETFHLTKDLGMAQRGLKGVARKPLKKTKKNRFFWLHFLEFSALK